MFGAELLEGKEYTFSEGAKVRVASMRLRCVRPVLTAATRVAQIPVYSWYGATVSVTDARALGDSAYISSDTPMNVFANIHQILEARRAEAVKTGTHGPRVRAARSLPHVNQSHVVPLSRCWLLAQLTRASRR